MKIIEVIAVTDCFHHKPDGGGRERVNKITLTSDDESIVLSITATAGAKMQPGDRFELVLRTVVKSDSPSPTQAEKETK